VDLTFERAFDFVVGNEGGFSDNPLDPGGRTNFGVTQDTYDEYRDSIGAPHRDVKSITHPEALAIYSRFWNKGSASFAKFPGLALQMFDQAINNPRQSIVLLQRVVGANPDGGFGALTLAAANAYLTSPAQIINAVKKYAELRFDWYWSLHRDAFEHGWLKRTLHTGMEAMRLAQESLPSA
jgi:lysozyme family protein